MNMFLHILYNKVRYNNRQLSLTCSEHIIPFFPHKKKELGGWIKILDVLQWRLVAQTMSVWSVSHAVQLGCFCSLLMWNHHWHFSLLTYFRKILVQKSTMSKSIRMSEKDLNLPICVLSEGPSCQCGKPPLFSSCNSFNTVPLYLKFHLFTA